MNQIVFRFVLTGAVLAAGWLTLDTLSGLAISAQEKKDEPKGKKEEPKEKKGVVTGVVVSKTKNTIKVKAFGEEKEREYFPKWVGGVPAQGGGFDKKTLAAFEKLKVGEKVRLVWEFEERFRAVQVESLEKKDPPKEEKK
jgi:hypothetical protein